MNTFENQADHTEDLEKAEQQSPQEKNPPAVLPPQEDKSLPVLPRPADRRAEAFLPEWLRRLGRS